MPRPAGPGDPLAVAHLAALLLEHGAEPVERPPSAGSAEAAAAWRLVAGLRASGLDAAGRRAAALALRGLAPACDAVPRAAAAA